MYLTRSPASAAMKLRPFLGQYVTWRRLAASNRRFGTANRSYLKGQAVREVHSRKVQALCTLLIALFHKTGVHGENVLQNCGCFVCLWFILRCCQYLRLYGVQCLTGNHVEGSSRGLIRITIRARACRN